MRVDAAADARRRSCPATKARSLEPATSMPMAFAAVSSSRTDRVARPVLDRTKLRTMTMTRTRKMKAPGPGGELGDADHAASALHFREGKDRVGVDHEGLDDDGEAQRGDAEIVAAQGENGKAEEEAHFGGEGARDEHGEEEDDLHAPRGRPGRRARRASRSRGRTSGGQGVARARPRRRRPTTMAMR